MLTLLYIIGIWGLVGMSFFAFQVFAYCRGPKHYYDMLQFAMEVSKHQLSQKFKDARAMCGDMHLIATSFFIASLWGPIMILDTVRFIRSINSCLQTAQNQQSKNPTDT